MTWAGQSYVLDSNGNVVNAASLTSASGFDYTHAFGETPEPGTVSLAACALCGIFLRIRPRGQRAN